MVIETELKDMEGRREPSVIEKVSELPLDLQKEFYNRFDSACGNWNDAINYGISHGDWAILTPLAKNKIEEGIYATLLQNL